MLYIYMYTCVLQNIDEDHLCKYVSRALYWLEICKIITIKYYKLNQFKILSIDL